MAFFFSSNYGFRYESLMYLLVLLGTVIGIPGTIVTMRFYGKRIKKESTSTALFLTSLAVFDMLSLVTNIPVVATTIYYFSADELSDTTEIIVLGYINRIPKYWSNMLLLLVAIERVLCVVLPHRVKNILTRRVAIVSIILVIITGPVVLFPMVIVEPLVVVPTNGTVMFLQRMTQTVVDPVVKTKLTIIAMFFYFVFPVIGVLISNICLSIVLVYKFKSEQARNTSNTMTPPQVKELRITKLVMLVTVIFIICVLPVMVFPLTADTGEKVPIWFVLVVRPVSVLLETINNSINFVVYNIGSRNFYNETREMFSRVCFCFKPPTETQVNK